jgi:protein-disulfide isomerase
VTTPRIGLTLIDMGEFWGMYDRILLSEFGTEPSARRRLARKLELDLDRYDADIAGGTHVAHVFEDFNSGTLSGVNGTPTFFINGARLDWDFQPQTLGDAVENAMAVVPGSQDPAPA